MSKKQTATKQNIFAKAVAEILKSQPNVEQSVNTIKLNERLRAIAEELAALTEIDAENRACIMLFVDKAQGNENEQKTIGLISGLFKNVDNCYANLLEDENIKRIAMKHVLGI